MLFGFNTLSLFKARASAELLSETARCADRLGFDSMWIGHHVIFETVFRSTYPYGPNPLAADDMRIDTWATFAFLAGVTKRLRFASGVYLAPLVSPFLTARAVATADYLSGGRMILGLGVGWNREEFDMLEQDFTTRGARTDEIIDILRRLFTEETIEHHGRFYNFGPVAFEPKPVQRPWPPMLYGGLSPPALARAARLEGCILPTNDLGEIAGALEVIHGHRRELGKANEPFDVTAVAPSPLSREALKPYADLGVTRVNFDVGSDALSPGYKPVPMTVEGITANLTRIADAVLG